MRKAAKSRGVNFVIQRACFTGGASTIPKRHDAHDEHARTERECQHHVGRHHCVSLVDDATIEPTARLFDVAGRQGPGLEEPRMPQPLVEPHRDQGPAGRLFLSAEL